MMLLHLFEATFKPEAMLCAAFASVADAADSERNRFSPSACATQENIS